MSVLGSGIAYKTIDLCQTEKKITVVTSWESTTQNQPKTNTNVEDPSQGVIP